MEVIGSFRTFYKCAATKQFLDNIRLPYIEEKNFTHYLLTRYFLPLSHD